jgi:hypothetical protein
LRYIVEKDPAITDFLCCGKNGGETPEQQSSKLKVAGSNPAGVANASRQTNNIN